MPLLRSYAKFKIAQKLFRSGRDMLAARNRKNARGKATGRRAGRR